MHDGDQHALGPGPRRPGGSAQGREPRGGQTEGVAGGGARPMLAKSGTGASAGAAPAAAGVPRLSDPEKRRLVRAVSIS